MSDESDSRYGEEKGQTDSGYGAGKQNREQYRRNLAWKCIRIISDGRNVYGSYIHGIFDKEKIVSEIVKSLAEKKGLSMEEVEGVDLKAFKESQYDLLADTLRKHLDMKAIYQIMGMQK